MMPLPDWVKRKTSAAPAVARPTPKVSLPLEGITLTEKQLSDFQDTSFIYTKTVRGILKNPRCLNFFVRYLETKSAVNLVQFLLDVRSFEVRFDHRGKTADIVNSDSVESFDSGIVSPSPERPPDPHGQAMAQIALAIYRTYLTPGSPTELGFFTAETVQKLISGICTESGEEMRKDCFEEPVVLVERRLESQYVQEFFSGPFYAKYELEILSQNEPQSIDILFNDELSFLFTEYLENAGAKGGRGLLEFCLNVNHLTGVLNQSDAMVVYDKYISMQAPSNLGFEASIRSKVEEKICTSSGATDSDCFREPLVVALHVLNEQYLSDFLSSGNYRKYLGELEKRSLKRTVLRRAGSNSSVNTCASSESSFNLSCQNTLLAGSSGKRTGHGFTNFLDRYNADPTFLWKRKNYKLTNIGHVDHLGRYVSCVTIPAENPTGKPRPIRLSNSFADVPISRKLSHAMKRLVISESEEKFREDMSWQVAEMIVNEVKSSLVKKS